MTTSFHLLRSLRMSGAVVLFPLNLHDLHRNKFTFALLSGVTGVNKKIICTHFSILPCLTDCHLEDVTQELATEYLWATDK